MTDTTAQKAIRELALLGSAMRRAQRAYFAKRRAMPHVPADAELRAAREAERRFDSAIDEALNDRPSLPGMEADDTGIPR